MPPTSTLTPPQRAGYALSLLCISAGWLLLLAAVLEWPFGLWSRSGLALQAGALVAALRLRTRLPAARLTIYPLILAASFYLWDPTLPPPNLPGGWPQEVVPAAVLVGLLLDCVWTLRAARHARRDPAARVLSEALHTHSAPHATRPGTTSRSGVRRQNTQHSPAPWWQIYAWIGLMCGLLLGVLPFVLPPGWEKLGQLTWCAVTVGGLHWWVRRNHAALDADAEQADRHSSAPEPEGERTVPLTAVQRHFLEVMDRQQHE